MNKTLSGNTYRKRMEDDYNEFELTELIKMAGRYFSYEEFVKDNPDLAEQVNQAFFYKACEGDTKERNVRELKRTYLKQPTEAYEEDLASRRNAVKQMLSQIKREKK